MQGTDFNSAEALGIIGFLRKESSLTPYNQFRRNKVNSAIFCTYVLVLHEFVIPSTSKDLL